jgi:hypothetical protein
MPSRPSGVNCQGVAWQALEASPKRQRKPLARHRKVANRRTNHIRQTTIVTEDLSIKNMTACARSLDSEVLEPGAGMLRTSPSGR